MIELVESLNSNSIMFSMPRFGIIRSKIMSSTDILLFESQLTDEELIIQKSANDYCHLN